MNHAVKKIAGVLLAAVLAIGAVAMVQPLQASAATTTIITIDNSKGDDNPFIRLFPNNKTFGSGGPFTVTFEVKIEGYKRMSGHTADSNCFVNTWNKDVGNKMTNLVNWQANMDWTPFTLSFNNISKVLIDGELRDYALIDIGILYNKSILHVRNFKIVNAAKKVVYSFDTDPDLAKIKDLRDIGGINPEPMVLNAAFGSSGTATFAITKADGGSAGTTKGTTTKTPAYEQDTTTKAATTTTIKNNAGTTKTTADKADNSVAGAGTEEISTQSTDPASGETSLTDAPSESTTTTAQKTMLVKKVNVGAVVGIVIGVIAVLAAAGVVIWLILRGKKKTAGMEQDNSPKE